MRFYTNHKNKITLNPKAITPEVIPYPAKIPTGTQICKSVSHKVFFLKPNLSIHIG